MEQSEQSKSTVSSEFAKLRRAIHQQQAKELEQRKRDNPQKSKEETMLGVYVEELEPQVRAAVIELNRKGYPTYSSGFSGKKSDLQTIEGDYKLDEATRNELGKMEVDAQVSESWKYKIERHQGIDRSDLPEDAKYTTTIQFRPTTANLQAITDTWNVIANKFPDRGHFAIPPYPKSKP